MARIRSIHPDALKSHKLAEASPEAERLYWRLLTNCDDEGRAEDEPRLLAAYLFPMNEDITGAVVDGWLKELDHLALLARYEVAGKPYLQVERWDDYQKPQKKTESKLPAIPADYARTTEPLQEDYGSSPVEECPVVGGGVGGGEGEGVSTPLSSSEPAKGSALALVESSPTATTAADRVFAAWCDSTGRTKSVFSDDRRKLVLKQLKTYPEADLIDAVYGWKLDPHCRGENDRHTVYNDLELILRDAKRIEKFRDLARGDPSVLPSLSRPAAWDTIDAVLGRGAS